MILYKKKKLGEKVCLKVRKNSLLAGMMMLVKVFPFKLGRMINSSRLYRFSPVLLIMTFTESHVVRRRQNFCALSDAKRSINLDRIWYEVDCFSRETTSLP